MGFLQSNIKALIFVLLATLGAIFYIKIIFNDNVTVFKWSIPCLIVTIIAFMIPTFWGVIICVALISQFKVYESENERIVDYFLFLPLILAYPFVLPSPIPGINYLFELSYPILLSLVFLLPSVITNNNQKQLIKVDGIVDKLIIVYVLYLFILNFRNPTITSALRDSFLMILVILIPYFAITRGISSLHDFRRVNKAILFTAIIVACIGILEQVTKWSFYKGIPAFLDLKHTYIIYTNDYRSGLMRIKGPIGMPIPLGFYLMFVLAIVTYFRYVSEKLIKGHTFTFILIFLSLLFTIARGPILGSIVFFLVFILLFLRNFFLKLTLVVCGLLIGITMFSSGYTTESIDDYGTFDYRLMLFESSIEVIKNNLLFGTNDIMDALEELRQGQGIIDIVNTYIGVAISQGIIGLSLFLSIPISLCFKLFTSISQKNVIVLEEQRALGSVLLALIISILVVISTTSMVIHIRFYYWATIGLAAAFCRISTNEKLRNNLEVT